MKSALVTVILLVALPWATATPILGEHDDAGSGRDAGPDAVTAVPVGDGWHEGALSLLSNDMTDTYLLSGEPGKVARITFSAPPAGLSPSPYATLYDPDRRPVVSLWDGGAIEVALHQDGHLLVIGRPDRDTPSSSPYSFGIDSRTYPYSVALPSDRAWQTWEVRWDESTSVFAFFHLAVPDKALEETQMYHVRGDLRWRDENGAERRSSFRSGSWYGSSWNRVGANPPGVELEVNVSLPSEGPGSMTAYAKASAVPGTLRVKSFADARLGNTSFLVYSDAPVEIRMADGDELFVWSRGNANADHHVDAAFLGYYGPRHWSLEADIPFWGMLDLSPGGWFEDPDGARTHLQAYRAGPVGVSPALWRFEDAAPGTWRFYMEESVESNDHYAFHGAPSPFLGLHDAPLP